MLLELRRAVNRMFCPICMFTLATLTLLVGSPLVNAQPNIREESITATSLVAGTLSEPTAIPDKETERYKKLIESDPFYQAIRDYAQGKIKDSKIAERLKDSDIAWRMCAVYCLRDNPHFYDMVNKVLMEDRPVVASTFSDDCPGLIRALKNKSYANKMRGYRYVLIFVPEEEKIPIYEFLMKGDSSSRVIGMFLLYYLRDNQIPRAKELFTHLDKEDHLVKRFLAYAEVVGEKAAMYPSARFYDFFPEFGGYDTFAGMLWLSYYMASLRTEEMAVEAHKIFKSRNPFYRLSAAIVLMSNDQYKKESLQVFLAAFEEILTNEEEDSIYSLLEELGHSKGASSLLFEHHDFSPLVDKIYSDERSLVRFGLIKLLKAYLLEKRQVPFMGLD